MKKVFVLFALIATMVNVFFASSDRMSIDSELEMNDVEIPAEAEVDAAFPWLPIIAIGTGVYLYYKSKQIGTVFRCNGTVLDCASEHFGQVEWECVEKQYTDEIKCGPVGHREYTQGVVEPK